MKTTIRCLAVFVLLLVAAKLSLRALPQHKDGPYSRPMLIERKAADWAYQIGCTPDWAKKIRLRERLYQIDQIMSAQRVVSPGTKIPPREEVKFEKNDKIQRILNKIISKPASATPSPTNLIVIMTDNHGAWTLGCYGNKDIKTPNIDRMAKNGILFTQAFACNAVCSPTRATFFTGLMPSQHGVHCFLRARNLQTGPNARSTMRPFTTLPEILNRLGYTCGLIGKWHLGDNTRPQIGFSTWVTTPHGGTLEFYDQQVIENGKTRIEKTYLTKYWTDRGCKFISENKKKPFFLFLSYNGPYGLGRSMLNPPRNRHAAYYKDKAMKSFPREKMHRWLHSTKNLHNNKTAIWRYAAEISAVDDGVGQILDTLKKHKLNEKTLVIFLGDQGLAGGHSGIWGMGDHTRPLTAFATTMHIPLIARHAGSIPAGQRSERMVANYDLLKTTLSYLGHGKHFPEKANSPGRDFSALLKGKAIDWKDEVYYEFENVRAVRTPQWNYVERIHQKPNELYDLKKDPGERTNLIDDEKNIAVQKILRARLQLFFKRYADPRWDLWRGGGSQTHLLTAEFFKKNKKSK